MTSDGWEENQAVGSGLPTSMAEVGRRLRDTLDLFASRKQAAGVAGVSPDQLARYLRGASSPPFEVLSRLAIAADVSLDWLATGEGEMRRGPGRLADRTAGELAGHVWPVGQLGESPAVFHGADLPAGFVLVPRYDVEASAGPGALTERENVIDYMAFQEGWARRALGVDPQGLALISARGDSMEPAIRAGDLLLIDTSVDQVEDDAIYVLVMDGHLVVKRLQRFVGGAVSVKSDNTAYVEQTLSAEELAAYAIITGRVRWIGRMI